MRYFILTLAIVLLLASQSSAQTQPNITDLKIISLESGTNKISSFTPDGRDGLIISGWRDNGNAHGYDVFIVMTPGNTQKEKQWNIVGVRGGDKFEDTLRDEPHAGEDYVRSIRFAKAKVNGMPATLLITAERQFSNGDTYYSPMVVNVDVYKLVPRAENELVGETEFIFDRIVEKQTKERYCNSNLALSKVFQLPLPDLSENANDCL